MRYLIQVGDAREWLAKLRAESIDALVCDPPAGISFMGKEWDHYDASGTASGLSGMRKDRPIGRAHSHGTQGVLDKFGASYARSLFVAGITPIFTLAMAAMKPGAHGLVWALPRTSHWTATALEDAGFEIRDIVMHLFGTGFPKSLDVSKAIDEKLGAAREPTGEVRTRHGGGAHSDKIRQLNPDAVETPITVPGSPEAERFSGWGTALKPAAEHWILIRKPLIGTVAANVLAHGTGALNIDGCRIQSGPSAGGSTSGLTALGQGSGWNAHANRETTIDRSMPLGRWPAHLTLDEEAAAVLDAQSSASRFFYVAKASRAEREAGLDDLPAKTAGEATGRVDGTDGLKSPRAGAGRTGGARNHHPTVKSVALMRWLIRLVTPPGGIVLDPFMGSGSTGVAALAEGMKFIGIEREAEYVEIARRRIAAAAPAAPSEEP
jgi:site-specific DNA-methyltransferase (adenine-specific)